MPLLSPQFLMTCNYLNEGCDGGWPFFHGYFGENSHLTTEECAPYQGMTKGDSCENYKNCPKFAKVTGSYFIGKGYGDSSEKKMMKEIIRNGLVNGELQAPSIFHMYHTGVLTQSGIKELSDKVQSLVQTGEMQGAQDIKMNQITDKSFKDYGISWQNLNHSVVIVGWGTDPVSGMKYWIVRNSYGPTWGDKGEFLVKRGTNDFGIESETTAYDFALCSEVGC